KVSDWFAVVVEHERPLLMVASSFQHRFQGWELRKGNRTAVVVLGGVHLSTDVAGRPIHLGPREGQYLRLCPPARKKRECDRSLEPLGKRGNEAAHLLGGEKPLPRVLYLEQGKCRDGPD